MKEVNFVRAPFDFLAHVKCSTGYCGSESTETFIVVAGTDIDALGLEMANENATSHGLDGQEVCASCGEDWDTDEDDNCSRCGQDTGSEWEESDSVEGNVIFWRPSHLGSCYASIGDILLMLVELGAAKIDSHTIWLYTDIIDNVIDLTEDGATKMLHDDIRSEYLNFDIIWSAKCSLKVLS